MCEAAGCFKGYGRLLMLILVCHVCFWIYWIVISNTSNNTSYVLYKKDTATFAEANAGIGPASKFTEKKLPIVTTIFIYSFCNVIYSLFSILMYFLNYLPRL